MSIIGGRAAIDLALPTSIDGSSVLNFILRNGMSAEQIIANAAVAVGEVNTEIINKWAGILYMTQMPYAYYTQGTGIRPRTAKKVEFKQADGSHSAQSGHMLPLTQYEDALEWTAAYLRDAYDAQLSGDVTIKGDAWRNRVTDELLQRIFFNTENAIGTGYDVPWAIGTGVNVPFIPQTFGNYTFDTNHTHFRGFAGAVSSTTTATALKALVLELRHHGHVGRLSAFVSDADLDSYTGMTDFVKLQPPQFTVVAGNANAPVNVTNGEIQGLPGELFGYYNSNRGVVELRYNERIPTGYLFLSKSYGSNNPKNGLAVREHPTRGFGMFLDPQMSRSLNNPEIDKVLLKAEHGIGVNDRTNGVVGFIGNATYANPATFL